MFTKLSKVPKFFVAAILVTTSLWLAGCQAPDPESVELTGRGEHPVSPDDLDSDAIGAPIDEFGQADLQLDDNTPTPPNQAPTPQQGGVMTKTLEDFSPHPASQATLVTTKGEIVIELFRDQAPLTTLNFLNLASEGFYDGIVFHRVIDDFMAQVGDPLSKNPEQQHLWGTGGPGYTIADEFHPQLRHDQAGRVSMANSGPNTGGSQFFITHGPTPWLDDKHAIFGQVVSGQEVVDSLTVGDVIQSITLE